ncbi:HAMP domain-containing histidine kinase [Subsaximicrobium wynnwilliamsii]|uniref:histidine kinase n=1 Tax=Subsaximicrobium wynnwilliamsii TaxID=291179 RepID=A0A5C6ZEP4_9FLAO|nr:HAMP domain-containing sensor histidine kinase [Subsaximicrobium wynnwilliamsii]TXD81796.1 HAMP domain-containing histidine kinase [Subsaximicrobium wynnwilliamsii]TXD87622.1 HAMP domain-containing histidine kinase [Subsaximicrobium wynnwilliamsii]TXE01295.1 HAMP domain-containing histidine kinase [Subsaximicrobium wynnwilliamsii]
MKLLNHTSKYLLFLLLPILTVWAFLFYYAMLDEIYDSLDDGLENQKIILMQQMLRDASILEHANFDEHIYSFSRISKSTHENFEESYRDTLMFMHNEKEFEPVRIFETAIKHDDEAYYKLKIITSMVEEDDLIESLVYYLLGLYALLVLTILVMNNLILRKIWKPFYTLIGQLGKFRIEKNTFVDIPSSNIEEFSLLNTTISQLINKARSSYTDQKQFIENASHELQTPLAISINKLELFLEHQNLSQEQSKDIVTVLDNLGRLTRMNKSLLLLSKIENKQFEEATKVNFNTLTETIISDFEDFAKHRKVHISIDAKAEIFYQINQDLATILLSNLIKNALIHGNKNEHVLIAIEPNTWSISNKGEQMPLDDTVIFSRFKKASTSKKSTGLGLAISKAIADKYTLNLSYTFTDAHSFTLKFY